MYDYYYVYYTFRNNKYSFVIIPLFAFITRDCGVSRSTSIRCREGDRFESRINLVMTKEIKNECYDSYVRSATLIVRVVGMHWP